MMTEGGGCTHIEAVETVRPPAARVCGGVRDDAVVSVGASANVSNLRQDALL